VEEVDMNKEICIVWGGEAEINNQLGRMWRGEMNKQLGIVWGGKDE